MNIRNINAINAVLPQLGHLLYQSTEGQNTSSSIKKANNTKKNIVIFIFNINENRLQNILTIDYLTSVILRRNAMILQAIVKRDQESEY